MHGDFGVLTQQGAVARIRLGLKKENDRALQPPFAVSLPVHVTIIDSFLGEMFLY